MAVDETTTTLVRGKRHLREPGPIGDTYHISWCGQRRGTPAVLVDDPSDATCLTCLARLGSDMDAAPQFPSYLRSRAYGRATSILRERHRDEFEAVLAEVLPVVVAEEWPQLHGRYRGGCASLAEYLARTLGSGSEATR